MPKFLIPSDLDKFLESRVKDISHCDFLKTKIQQTIESGVYPKKKLFAKKLAYTINADYSKHQQRYCHRLIFDLAIIDNQEIYVLRDIAWNHDYDKALNWQPLGKIKSLALPKEYDFSKINYQDSDEIRPSTAEVTMVNYKDKWYQPTPLQSQIISNTKLPQLLVGAPGSGKTLVAMAILQEQALAHQESGSQEPLNLLYISDNPALVTSLKKSWSKWRKNNLDPKHSNICVNFFSYQEFFELYLNNDNTLLESNKLKDLINAATKRKNKELSSATISADKINQELKLSAFYLLKDIAENKSYENSYYKSLGQQQCLYKDEAEKSIAYSIMIESLQKVIEGRQYHPDISMLPQIGEQDKYQIVMADEAQNLSILKIMNLVEVAENNKLLLLGDSLQKGEIKISSLALIKDVLYHAKNIQLEQNTLPLTFRLGPENARVLNQLILLYGNLKQGKADSTAYTSLNSAYDFETTNNDENQNDFIEYVEHYTNDFKVLGKKATAAAIVLDEKDKDSASRLINGDNVFDVHEAQGLDFSEVFFYISEESAQKLIALSNKMQQLNINSQTELKEYLNQSPQKTQLDGIELEVLSNLIVGLSRSTGANWLYIEENIEPKLKHKIMPFLDWLKLTIKVEKVEIKTVEQAISSKDEWLLAINKFIEQGAIKQARENLKNIFELTEAQIIKYIALYKNNELPQTLVEFNDVFGSSLENTNHRQQTVQEPKEIKTSKKVFPEIKNSAHQETTQNLTKDLTLSDSDKKFNFEPLSSGYKNFVEKLYKNLTSANNIKSLLENKFILPILFDHKMEEGETLFANIMIFNKWDIFIKHLNSLLAKESSGITKAQINDIFNNGYKIAQDNNDYALMLAVSQFCELKESQSLNIRGIPTIAKTLASFREGDISRLGQIFHYSTAVGNVGVYQWLKQNTAIYRNLLKQDLNSQFINENDEHGLSYMFMRIFLLEKEGILNNIESKAMGVAIDSSITLADYEFKGITGLMVLLGSEAGLNFLEKSWHWIKKGITEDNFVRKVNVDDTQHRKNALYLFCELDVGQKLLLSDWSFFEKFIKPDNFYSLMTMHDKVLDSTFILGFCTNSYGLKLLSKKWQYFEAFLLNQPAALSTKVYIEATETTTFPLYQLCMSEDGIRLIHDKWSFIQEIVPIESFWQSATSKCLENAGTIMHSFCSIELGIKLLRANWQYFEKIFSKNPDVLLSKVKQVNQDMNPHSNVDQYTEGLTPLYLLCSYKYGIELISEKWHFLKLIIPVDAFFRSINASNKSAFYQMTTTTEGCLFIAENWDYFKSGLTAEHLFLRTSEHSKLINLNPFYNLCTTKSGIALMDNDWLFFEKIITEGELFSKIMAPAWGERQKICTPFAKLCLTDAGVELIDKHWDFFKKFIGDKIISGSERIAVIPYQVLCSTNYGQQLIKKHWQDFSGVISLEYIEQNPCPGSKKLLTMMKGITKAETAQQVMSQYSSTIFKPSAKATKSTTQEDIIETLTQLGFKIN